MLLKQKGETVEPNTKLAIVEVGYLGCLEVNGASDVGFAPLWESRPDVVLGCHQS